MLGMSEPGSEPGMTDEELAEQQRSAGCGWPRCRRTGSRAWSSAAADLTACDDPEFHYRFGIDLFIAGVRAMARRQDAAGSD